MCVFGHALASTFNEGWCNPGENETLIPEIRVATKVRSSSSSGLVKSVALEVVHCCVCSPVGSNYPWLIQCLSIVSHVCAVQFEWQVGLLVPA